MNVRPSGGTVDGRLVDRGDGRPAVRFERRLAASPERVWRAVTDEEELRAWFPCRVVGERRVGATLRFPFGADEPADRVGVDEGVVDEGVVTAWDPPRSWAFLWGGFEVSIVVAPADDGGGGSVLRFTQDVPVDRGPAARQAAGWQACLDGLLRHLDGVDAAEGGAASAWRAAYGEYLRTTPAALAEVSSSTTLTWRRSHHADVAKVWRCLTDGAEVSAWWGAPITIDLRVGGLVHFDFRPAAEPFDGVVVAVEEGRRFAFTFGAPSSVVEWEVAPASAAEGTELTLTHHDVDASVAGSPDFDVPGTAAGWHGLLHQLDLYLAAGEPAVGADDEPARREEYGRLLEP